MRLTEWAKKQGVHYRTALRWFHEGTLPVEATQLPSGTVLILDSSTAQATTAETKAIIYALYPALIKRKI